MTTSKSVSLPLIEVDEPLLDAAGPCPQRRGFLRTAGLLLGSLIALPVLARSAGKKSPTTAKAPAGRSAPLARGAVRPAPAVGRVAKSAPPVAHNGRSVPAAVAAGKKGAAGKPVLALRQAKPGRGDLKIRLDAKGRPLGGRVVAQIRGGNGYKSQLRSTGRGYVARGTGRGEESRYGRGSTDGDTRALEAPSIVTDSKTASTESLFRNGDRLITFYAPSTGESIRTAFWTPTNGYLPQSIKEISWVLRDHHNDEFRLFDPRVLDILYAVQLMMQRSETHIISGYRSPETNALLREESRGVAKNSFHMQARALDVRMPGASIAQMHRAATSLRAGGVGYYPRSNFVHVDSGPVRTWG